MSDQHRNFNDTLEAAFSGNVEKVELTGRMLRVDHTIADEMMDDRQLFLRVMKDRMYGDMRAALTTSIWGRDIGEYRYHVPERTTDYLLIWLRDTLNRHRLTRWIVRRLPAIRLRTVVVEVREEFPEFHPTPQLGQTCIAMYRRVEGA